MSGINTKVTITINTMDINSVPALLTELAENIRKENISGDLTKSDGDAINWDTKVKQT